MAESVWVEIVKAKEKLIFAVIYRPPNAADGVKTALFQEISRVARYGNVCICGNFNYSGIDWTNLVGDAQAERFIEITQDNFLKQLINEPTKGNNILDLILCKNENTIGEIEVGGNLENSNYQEIRFKLRGKPKVNCNEIRVPNFRLADYEGMRQQLSPVTWEATESGQSYGRGGRGRPTEEISAGVGGSGSSDMSGMEGAARGGEGDIITVEDRESEMLEIDFTSNQYMIENMYVNFTIKIIEAQNCNISSKVVN